MHTKTDFKHGFYSTLAPRKYFYRPINGDEFSDNEKSNVFETFRFLPDAYTSPVHQGLFRFKTAIQRGTTGLGVKWAWKADLGISETDFIVRGGAPGTYTVEYVGPPEYYSPLYRLDNCNDPKILGYRAVIENAYRNGDSRFRTSKRSGKIMFNVTFPRYRNNGEWWSSTDDKYLSTDPALAEEQMNFLGLI